MKWTVHDKNVNWGPAPTGGWVPHNPLEQQRTDALAYIRYGNYALELMDKLVTWSMRKRRWYMPKHPEQLNTAIETYFLKRVIR